MVRIRPCLDGGLRPPRPDVVNQLFLLVGVAVDVLRKETSFTFLERFLACTQLFGVKPGDAKTEPSHRRCLIEHQSFLERLTRKIV